jgi:FtsP/CotA-like multicopper oxidase with cupredoxin domain
MQTKLRNLNKLAAALLLIVALLASGFTSATVHAAPATCSGVTGSDSFDLYATSGSVTLPAPTLANPAATQSVTVLGYNLDGTTALTAPGGPVLTVNQCDSVSVTLHNTLPMTENTSLLFQGQAMIPDLTGVPSPSGTRTYTFTASQPGTYLYEAGLLNNAQHQVAMGLYGVLVVNPTGVPSGQSWAYDASSAYDDQAVVLLSEIDPALNNNASPANFDMRDYHPSYWLINGKEFPDTAPIQTQPGHKLLLRYVNAGIRPHAMGLLGVDQTFVAQDGSWLRDSRSYIAESIAPGETLDSLVAMPAASVAGTKFALYSSELMQHNNNASGFGGMLTFIVSGTAVVGADAAGPTTSAVALTHNAPGSATDPYTLSAHISDVSSGNSNIQDAEFFIDNITSNGNGTHMTGSFGASSVADVSATLLAADIAALTGGNHHIYVHGQDQANNWGNFNSYTLYVDKTGPAVSALSLVTSPTNGSVNVTITATANDTATGNANIQDGQYTIAGDATVYPMTANVAQPIANLTGTIATAGLSEGDHVITVQGRDSLGNLGASATITLSVDKTGPTFVSGSASPTNNNGTQTYSTSVPAVRVFATFTDANNLKTAEGFIDNTGITPQPAFVTGTGFVFIAKDGVYNSHSELGYTDIPIASIAALPDGFHHIWVHARDIAGNWGALDGSITIFTDKNGPVVSNIAFNPAATNNSPVALTATADDTTKGGSNVVAGEYFIGTVGAVGTGTVMSVNPTAPVATLSATIPASAFTAVANGTSLKVYVRAKDLMGNWGALVLKTLLVDKAVPTLTSISLSPTFIVVGTPSVNLTLNGAADTGSGVVGGEYWFDTATIPNGTGTPFTGTTNLTINTASLALGNHTVRVRIRDAAGNWSTTIRSANLSVIADLIFANTFATSTSPFGWTSVTGTVTRFAGADMDASGFGISVAGNGANYVQNNFTPASGTYDARFYFNPNNNATSTAQSIFVAASGTTNASFSTPIFRVRYQVNGGVRQVQVLLVASGATSNWMNVNATASNYIEVVYVAGNGAANSGSLTLYVNGVAATTVVPVTAATTVTAVRLGSVVGGSTPTTAEFFDAFSSKRSTSPLIGQ